MRINTAAQPSIHFKNWLRSGPRSTNIKRQCSRLVWATREYSGDPLIAHIANPSTGNHLVETSVRHAYTQKRPFIKRLIDVATAMGPVFGWSLNVILLFHIRFGGSVPYAVGTKIWMHPNVSTELWEAPSAGASYHLYV